MTTTDPPAPGTAWCPNCGAHLARPGHACEVCEPEDGDAIRGRIARACAAAQVYRSWEAP